MAFKHCTSNIFITLLRVIPTMAFKHCTSNIFITLLGVIPTMAFKHCAWTVSWCCFVMTRNSIWQLRAASTQCAFWSVNELLVKPLRPMICDNDLWWCFVMTYCDDALWKWSVIMICDDALWWCVVGGGRGEGEEEQQPSPARCGKNLWNSYPVRFHTDERTSFCKPILSPSPASHFATIPNLGFSINWLDAVRVPWCPYTAKSGRLVSHCTFCSSSKTVDICSFTMTGRLAALPVLVQAISWVFPYLPASTSGTTEAFPHPKIGPSTIAFDDACRAKPATRTENNARLYAWSIIKF